LAGQVLRFVAARFFTSWVDSTRSQQGTACISATRLGLSRVATPLVPSGVNASVAFTARIDASRVVPALDISPLAPSARVVTARVDVPHLVKSRGFTTRLDAKRANASRGDAKSIGKRFNPRT